MGEARAPIVDLLKLLHYHRIFFYVSGLSYGNFRGSDYLSYIQDQAYYFVLRKVIYFSTSSISWLFSTSSLNDCWLFSDSSLNDGLGMRR